MINKRIQELNDLRQNRLNGKVNCIPFTDTFPKISQFVPGIIKGHMYQVVAHSGVGKTQLTRYLFIWTPYIYNKLHPESKIDYDLILFLLEESKDEFIDSMISTMLFFKYGIRVDPIELESLKENPLSEEVLQKIIDIEQDLDEFLSHCYINDSVTNVTGAFKYCRHHSNLNGTHYWTPLVGELNEITGDEYQKLDDSIKKDYKYSRYVPNNPDKYTLVITDNINLWSEEYDSMQKRQLNLAETIDKWCYNYCRKQLSKNYNYSIINIQQLANADEAQQFTNRGESIIAKVKPQLSMLADTKKSQRHHMTIIWIFAPDRYEIDEYEGYNIESLRDTIRTIGIAKNRKGISNKEIPCYFDGAINFFREMPLPKEMTNDTYRKCIEYKIKPGFKI